MACALSPDVIGRRSLQWALLPIVVVTLSLGWGGFSDRLLSRVSSGKPFPLFLRDMKFRWFALVALVGFMLFQMANKPLGADWIPHIGQVFWRMCVITTTLSFPSPFLTLEGKERRTV